MELQTVTVQMLLLNVQVQFQQHDKVWIFYAKKVSTVKIGIFKDAEIPFDMEKVIQKEITVVGSRSQKPADWEPSLQLMADGLVNAEALVTKIYDISKWDEAYQHLKSGEGIKVLLKPLDLDENEGEN